MCNHLRANKENAPFKNLLGNRNFDQYLEKKSKTSGERFTWSDSITMNAMAAVEGRPIVQVTYPVYQNGKA